MKTKPQVLQLSQLGCPHASVIASADALGNVPESTWKEVLFWLCAKIDPAQCKTQDDLPAFLASFGISPPVANFVSRKSCEADLRAGFELLLQGARAVAAAGLAKRYSDSCLFMTHVIQNREKLFPASLKRFYYNGIDSEEIIPLQKFNPNKRHRSLIKMNSELENKIRKLEQAASSSSSSSSGGYDVASMNSLERSLTFEAVRDPFPDKQKDDMEITLSKSDCSSVVDKCNCVCAVRDALKEISETGK